MIAFTDDDQPRLALASCSDPSCSSVSITTIHANATSATPNLTIGSSARPLISYIGHSANGLPMLATRSRSSWRENDWDS